MSKTIAEMLVETIATLGASPERGVREGCAKLAREIVAEVYGPPCEQVLDPRDCVTDPNFDWKTAPTPRRSAACLRCGWPKSQHQEPSE